MAIKAARQESLSRNRDLRPEAGGFTACSWWCARHVRYHRELVLTQLLPGGEPAGSLAWIDAAIPQGWVRLAMSSGGVARPSLNHRLPALKPSGFTNRVCVTYRLVGETLPESADRFLVPSPILECALNGSVGESVSQP